MNIPKSQEELLMLLDDGGLTESQKIELVRAYAQAKRREKMAYILATIFKTIARRTKAIFGKIATQLHLRKVAHG